MGFLNGAKSLSRFGGAPAGCQAQTRGGAFGASQPQNEPVWPGRGAAGSLLGFAVSIGLFSLADRIGLDASFVNSLSPNTALLAGIATKIFLAAMIMVPGALAYEFGARKLEARDRAAKP